MPGPNFVLDKGYTPTTAVGQFRAVAYVTSDKQAVTLQTTAGALCVGICQEEVPVGDTPKRVVDIRMAGISRAVASAAVAVGAKVASTVDGRMATATTGQQVVGIATTGAGIAGDHFDVLLTPGAVA